MNPLRSLLLSLGVAPLLGCYRYVPATLEAVPAGSEIRVLLSTEGQVAMLHEVGIDARSIIGTLEGNDGAAAHLAVLAPFAVPRPGAPLEYVRLALPSKDILRLEVRQFDRVRTFAFMGVMAGVTATIAIMIASGTREGGSQPPADGIPPVR
jgi:hypothetical protein